MEHCIFTEVCKFSELLELREDIEKLNLTFELHKQKMLNKNQVKFNDKIYFISNVFL